MDKVALSYLVKMKGTHSLELLKISKPIWQYLMSHGIIITAEYLRNVRDLSDWKLDIHQWNYFHADCAINFHKM